MTLSYRIGYALSEEQTAALAALPDTTMTSNKIADLRALFGQVMGGKWTRENMRGMSDYFANAGTPFITDSNAQTICRNEDYTDEKGLLDSIVGYGGSLTKDNSSDELHTPSGTFSFGMLEPGDYFLASDGSIYLYLGKDGEDYRLAGKSEVKKYTAEQASAFISGFKGYVIIRKNLDFDVAEYGKSQ